MSALPPEAQLWQLLRGVMATQALRVAAHFRVADALAEGPRPLADVAAEADADEDALYRFLRALATEGVFEEEGSRVFRNTPASELLRTDGEERWHEFALQFGAEWHRAFAEAPHAARTGEATFPVVFGSEFTEWLRENPESLARFSRSMEGGAAERVERIAALPWDAEVVVDVGGGTGGTLIELLRRHPRLRGVVFDLPEVAGGAEERIAAAGLTSRCAVAAGNYVEAVPAGDAYVLSRILHGCDDASAGAIIRNVRAAARPRARVLVLDAVLPAGNEPHGGKWLDLLMLVLGGGRERTENEWRRLLEATGLELEEIDDGLVVASCP